MGYEENEHRKMILVAGFIVAIMLAVPAIGYAVGSSAQTYNVGNAVSIQCLDVQFYHYIGDGIPEKEYEWNEQTSVNFETVQSFTRQTTVEYARGDATHHVDESVAAEEVFIRVTSLLPKTETFTIVPKYMIEDVVEGEILPSFVFGIGNEIRKAANTEFSGLTLGNLYEIDADILYESSTAPRTTPYSYWISLIVSLDSTSAVSQNDSVTIKEHQRTPMTDDEHAVQAMMEYQAEKNNPYFAESGNYTMSAGLNGLVREDLPSGSVVVELQSKDGPQGSIIDNTGKVQFRLYVPEDVYFAIVVVATNKETLNKDPHLYLTVSINGTEYYPTPQDIKGTTTKMTWERFVVKASTSIDNHQLSVVNNQNQANNMNYWLTGKNVILELDTKSPQGGQSVYHDNIDYHLGIIMCPTTPPNP